ncbi:carboxylesterase/lipase family protein [Actinoallomurus iriomotensis]|uniref:Carboxylic ester hydrolase n=1 Tax=Actinoallomurus iriomotensis TaxID=478107 RepID=A0A9W6S601_9ACTN|nr:carboxylesterase family protein [Actinoallomurus iriomotensis]GLY87748.1 carboxylic ester hydrolase [Actinoallomurus iriomotensis]
MRKALGGRLAAAIGTAGAVGVTAALVATPATAVGAVAGSTTAVSATVRTDKGLVRGTVTGDYRSFQGIPYAAPPVGELRWRSPHPAAAWAGVRDATAPGALCAQSGDHLGQSSQAEDCLYLNVTTPPKAAPGKRLPVLVWVHGGSFKDGAGSLYGARRLAVQGQAVVVTINYRLGVFGFLAHPALDQERELSGDFGLQDQQAALRWVRRNAAVFGGDPANVTLAGESSGAISTCAQLTAPGSAGLFDRAIVQSAPCTAPSGSSMAMANNPRPRAQAERDGEALVERLKLDAAPTAERLRQVPVQELLKAAADAAQPGFGPVVGGSVLPEDPARAIAGGRFHHVPVLAGTNHDEERMHVWGLEMAKYGGPIPADAYIDEVRAAFGDDAEEVLARYPLSRYASASQALATALTDAEYAKPALDTYNALSRRVPTYAYEFADTNAPWFAGVPKPYAMGAYHAAELPYLFETTGTEPLTESQQPLSDQMIGYWTRFARTGAPNGSAAPVWQRFTPTRPYVQSLAPGEHGIKPASFARDHDYAFWNSLGG